CFVLSSFVCVVVRRYARTLFFPYTTLFRSRHLLVPANGCEFGIGSHVAQVLNGFGLVFQNINGNKHDLFRFFLIDTIKIIWNIRECKSKITLVNHGQKLKGRGKKYDCRVRVTSRIRNNWLYSWETERGKKRYSTWQ